MLCFSLIISNCEDRVLFLAYPFNRSLIQVLSFCQIHVLFLPSSTGVLPKFFPSHLVLTRVVPIPSCPLYSSFIALQPPRFTWCSLFPFSTAVLSIVFNSVVFFLSTFQPLKVLWFHSFVEEAT